MGFLQVQAKALSSFANRCRDLASELKMDLTPKVAVESIQATALAVGSVNSDVAEAANKMASRLEAVGVKLDLGAAAYVSQDDAAARRIDSAWSTQQP